MKFLRDILKWTLSTIIAIPVLMGLGLVFIIGSLFELCAGKEDEE